MRIYVGNLSFNTTEGDVRKLFEGQGPVGSCSLITDKMTGNSRGFAFVEMSTDEEAQKAITELNEFQLGGRGLTVNEARPKPASAGGFGGGDSRRRREPRW